MSIGRLLKIQRKACMGLPVTKEEEEYFFRELKRREDDTEIFEHWIWVILKWLALFWFLIWLLG